MRRTHVWLACACVALTLTACGGDDSPPTSNAAKATALTPLKVAYPAAVTSTMPAYVAKAKGFFADEGLDVSITDGLGANVANLVVSGQYDIGMIGLSTPIITAKQGKPTKVTYGLGGGGSGGMIFGGPKVTSIDQLKSNGKCRIATFPPGSAANGNATHYKKTQLTNCDIVPLTDVPSIIAAVTSGRADAMVGNFNAAASKAVDEGKLHILVDTRAEADRQQWLGADGIVAEFGEWGLTATLEKKRDSVVAYYRAIKKATAFISSASDEDVAALLHKDKTFADRDLPALAAEVKSNRAYLTVGTSDGHIDQAQWDRSVKTFAAWGIEGIDPADSVTSYAERVDMSYLDSDGAR